MKSSSVKNQMVTGIQLFVLKSFQRSSNTKLFVIHLNITLLYSTLVKRSYRTKKVDFQFTQNSIWDIQLTLWPILVIK